MLKTTILKTASLFVAATAASFIFSSAAPAQAARAITPSSACWIDTDYIGDYSFKNGIANGSTGVGARARRVICPVPDNASNPRSGIGTMYIDGYDANNGPNSTDSVLAQVCLIQYNGFGMDCSLQTYASSGTYTGLFDTPLNPLNAAGKNVLTDPTVNATEGDWYPSLFISLPTQGIYGQSQFFGFTTF